MKKLISIALINILLVSASAYALEVPGGPTSFRPGGGPAVTTLPLTTSPSVVRVVASTLSGSISTSAIAQDEVGEALAALINSYERRATRFQDEINRLRIENTELRAKLVLLPAAPANIPRTIVAPIRTLVTLATPPKTDTEKRYDAIVSNIVSSLPAILTKNKLSATGSIGLFEFIEPRNFFISLDDGNNPAGVTAFKTKILFEYDANLNLKVIGVFNLDYGTSRYVTTFGTNPFGGVTRVRVKNPSYAGKLLEEIPTTTGSALSWTTSTTTVAKPTIPTLIASGAVVPATASLDEVRKAYDRNKLADAITLSTLYLAKTPTDTEVLTIRARSQYIFGRYDEALTDITSIFKIQGSAVDCGIVKDGARAEKALKGVRGNVFADLQMKQCK